MTSTALRAPKSPIRQPTDGRPRNGTAQLVTLIGAGSVGAAVALSLGVYGRSHAPTGATIDPIHPEQLLQVKSALTSVGAALVVIQLMTALWMYGRGPMPVSRPPWLAPAHRWSGTAAFIITLPVAYHCLWSLGFQTTTTRVLVHSLLGCAFYGAFATKLLLIRARRIPAWALPLAGGTVVTVMVALWFSSALWFYT